MQETLQTIAPSAGRIGCQENTAKDREPQEETVDYPDGSAQEDRNHQRSSVEEVETGF